MPKKKSKFQKSKNPCDLGYSRSLMAGPAAPGTSSSFEYRPAPNPIEEALAKAQIVAAEIRSALRVYEAQRYTVGGVRLDAVLRAHLGLG